MRYTRRLISFVMLTMLVGLGSLMLSTDHVRATENGSNCTITIEKDADPADDTPFDFSAPGTNNINFTLMDPSNVTDTVGLNADQTVNVTEDVPEGWSLDDIVCDEPENVEILDIPNGKSFECLSTGGTAKCTFFNVKEPTNIPTLSEWGLIAMAGGLGIVGLLVLAIRRRKVTA